MGEPNPKLLASGARKRDTLRISVWTLKQGNNMPMSGNNIT